MQTILKKGWMLGILLISGNNLYAHGIPVYVFSNTITERLFLLDNFEPAVLLLEQGIEISTASPGFGVISPTSGILLGTELGLKVSGPLLYWDGSEITSPGTPLWVDNPSQSSTYQVTETTGEQNGMLWAIYPGGDSPWDAHGLYSLANLHAPAGIYGLILQVTSNTYESTKPFLFPLIYDPSGQWNLMELNAGIDLLRNEIPLFGTADMDEDSDVDGQDFLTWQRHVGPASLTTLYGDADGDSDVDGDDLKLLSRQYGMAPSQEPVQQIPEPSSNLPVLIGMLGWSGIHFSLARGQNGHLRQPV